MENPSSLKLLIQRLKLRDDDRWALLLLDALAPLAPVLAQCLWIAQPLARPFAGQCLIAELAEALEKPEGIERLRRQLADEAE